MKNNVVCTVMRCGANIELNRRPQICTIIQCVRWGVGMCLDEKCQSFKDKTTHLALGTGRPVCQRDLSVSLPEHACVSYLVILEDTTTHLALGTVRLVCQMGLPAS